ncbi:MAG: VWA domain-containing protein [Terriglobia bacterium]
MPRLIEQGDEVALIAFSDTPTLLLDFTEDKNRLGMALEQTLLSAKESASASDAIYFEGSTNINDSVFLASKKLETAGYERRRVIVLVSDGMGNRGESIRASEELKFSGAALLNIGVGLTSKFHRGSMLMHRWIKESGGAMVLYSREAEMHDNLQTAFQRIRSRYGIAYSPSNRKKDGMYRRVRLEIARNSPYALRNLTIRGSHGYFAPLDISRPSNGNALFNVSKMGEPRTFEPKDFAHPVIGESSVETLFGNH